MDALVVRSELEMRQVVPNVVVMYVLLDELYEFRHCNWLGKRNGCFLHIWIVFLVVIPEGNDMRLSEKLDQNRIWIVFSSSSL